MGIPLISDAWTNAKNGIINYVCSNRANTMKLYCKRHGIDLEWLTLPDGKQRVTTSNAGYQSKADALHGNLRYQNFTVTASTHSSAYVSLGLEFSDLKARDGVIIVHNNSNKDHAYKVLEPRDGFGDPPKELGFVYDQRFVDKGPLAQHCEASFG